MGEKVRYEDKPWLAHYAEGIPEYIDYEEKTLSDFLERTVANCPERVAFEYEGYEITYREFYDYVNRMATCLADFGVKKGDSVAILLPNLIPVAVGLFAILKVGGIVVMNNPLSSDRELKHQLSGSGSKVLITFDALVNRMVDLRSETGIKQIIYTSMGDYHPSPEKELFVDVADADDVFKWNDILEKYPPEPPEVKMSFEDTAIYQYTGGTTGVSKGAILTHGNMSTQTQQVAVWFQDLKDEDFKALAAMPIFHVFGLTLMSMVVYMEGRSIFVTKPQPDVLLDSIRKYKPNYVPMAPTMYIGILNHPDFDNIDFSCLKGCTCGASPLPVEVIKEFESKTGAFIVEALGMTECSPAVTANPFKRGKGRIGSVGIPFPDTLCRVVDIEDSEKEVPVGEEGELVIKGPQVMKGYLNMPGETENALRDGWFYSGDIVKMDEDGYFYVVDRKKDMIISGGYNVFPREIDEVFFENPKVKEACAVGIPHPTRGEQIKVFVALKEGETATEEEMINFCADKVAKYKLPTQIEFMPDLPKTTVGKILRKDLRKLLS
ncbi:MAG: long-chain fatty acid--CoA ligase [Desulfobacterales bacterium]|nr:long-chain fatty acid--CoA ligase [Desulfobacteraceae bacterium]MBT4363467.1 long-chain fatty acid--CoA ligase [Desulfobacteraceae bacterium]MBT7084869.1 long-chain fatty acid--CoA ligase [Desulfobacterales bacterium]MBT7698268.1 long-chain fatty acid--CoA ligase [Desulfobacterales bacterium]